MNLINLVMQKLFNVFGLFVLIMCLQACQSRQDSAIKSLTKGCWWPTVAHQKVPYHLGPYSNSESQKQNSFVQAAPPIFFLGASTLQIHSFFIIPHHHSLSKNTSDKWVLQLYGRNNWLLSCQGPDSFVCTINMDTSSIKLTYTHLYRDANTCSLDLNQLENTLIQSAWQLSSQKKAPLSFEKQSTIKQDSLFEYSSLKIGLKSSLTVGNRAQAIDYPIELHQFKDAIIAEFIMDYQANQWYLLEQYDPTKQRLLWRSFPSNINKETLEMTKLDLKAQ